MTTTESARHFYYIEMRPEAGGLWVRFGGSPDQQTPDGPYGGWSTVNKDRTFAALRDLAPTIPADRLMRVTGSDGYIGSTRNGEA